MTRHKIYDMSFASVYPLYVNKLQKKGIKEQELRQIIEWLTGYSDNALLRAIEDKSTFEKFFDDAPRLNPSRKKITGTICGLRVEEIEDPLMQEIRYLDKLVDELARGKKLTSVLRS